MKKQGWAYVANITLPSVRANAVQVLNQCQALAQAGRPVELIVPRRWLKHKDAGTMASLAQDLGLSRPPKIRRLPCLDLIAVGEWLPGRLKVAAFYVQHLSFLSLAALVILWGRFEAVYTREVHLPLVFGRLLNRGGRKLALEIHDFPSGALGRAVQARAAARCRAVVVISHGLARAFDQAGIKPRRLAVAPDGVAERFFEIPAEKTEARRALGLPEDDLPLVMYCGGLYWAWKGVAGLLEAHQELDERARLVIVGGSPNPEHLEQLKTQAGELGLKRIIFSGFVNPVRVPDWLAAADVLVLPNSASAKISASYTSPLKLFEYLASGRPVVASALPSLREVLIDQVNALLVEPDDPAALARGIGRLLDEADTARRLGLAGRETAKNYTWDRRAQTLIEALS